MLSNAAGECSSSAALTVKAKPSADELKLLKGLVDAFISEGEPLKLQAEISGKPKLVKWYKNGKELSPDDHIAIV